MRRSIAGLVAVCALGLVGAATPAASQEVLPLEAAIQMALAQSATLRMKGLGEDSARAAYREALSRALPQVALTATGTYMTNPQEGLTVQKGAFGTLTIPTLPPMPPTTLSLPEEDVVLREDADPTYFQVSLGLDQVLWTWGKIDRSIRVAALERQAASAASRDAARQIRRDLGRAYVAAVTARESLRLLDEAVMLGAQAVADQERAFAEGTLVQLDVLEARSQQAGIVAQREKARESLETALATLEYLTGLRPQPQALVTPPRTAAPDLDQAELLSSALTGSAELETLGIRARQAAYAQEIRRRSLLGLPELSLKVTVDLSGQPVPFTENWTEGWDANVLVTLAGRLTVFDSLSSVWRLEQATAQREQAVQAEAELRRSLQVQVRRLVETARTAAATVSLREAEAALEAERARSARVGLVNEMVTRADERRAQVASLAAQLALVGARLEVEYALIGLEYMTGQSFPR